MNTPYGIGDFSKVTGLSIKTLRFYHEKGILVPTAVDQATGYRFYDVGLVEKARIIMQLRQMEFSLEDIAVVLGEYDDEADIFSFLEKQKEFLQRRIREDRDIVRSLNEIIAKETAARQLLAASTLVVEEKAFAPLLIAGIRMKGKYSDGGAGFSRLGEAVGRYICGKPLCLYYDNEFREDDADFEPCFPIRQEVTVTGVSVRTLAGGRGLALVHRGPYDQLGRSYAKLLRQAGERRLNLTLPTREVYLKGPGMIFKGSPKNYLTEIQLPFNG